MKRCSCCGETKPLEDFHRDSGSRDGLYAYCKRCSRGKNDEFRARNPNYHRDYCRERRASARAKWAAIAAEAAASA